MFIVYVIGWLACAVTIYAVARTTVEQSWTRSDAISLLSLVIPWWPLVLLWLLLRPKQIANRERQFHLCLPAKA